MSNNSFDRYCCFCLSVLRKDKGLNLNDTLKQAILMFFDIDVSIYIYIYIDVIAICIFINYLMVHMYINKICL